MSGLFNEDEEDDYVRPIFDARALSWALYWQSDELRRDFAVLTRGRLQAMCAAEGRDTPAGFFYGAARSYVPSDDLGKLARRACVLVAMSFEEGRPQ